MILSECVDMNEDMGNGGNARSNQEIYVFQEQCLLYVKASKGITMNFWDGKMANGSEEVILTEALLREGDARPASTRDSRNESKRCRTEANGCI